MKNFIIKILGGYTKKDIQAVLIENKMPKQLEASFYWKVPLYIEGKYKELLFTKSDISKALLRTSKNQEDIK
jgi:hypothetical protein